SEASRRRAGSLAAPPHRARERAQLPRRTPYAAAIAALLRQNEQQTRTRLASMRCASGGGRHRHAPTRLFSLRSASVNALGRVDRAGHRLELIDAAHPYIREALGPTLFQQWLNRGTIIKRAQAPMTLDERRQTRSPQGAWWGTHTVNVLDRATATLPALLHER